MQLVTRTLKGDVDGPKLLILGGVHGDEFEAMSAIRRLLNLIDPVSLHGQLTLIPVANESAFLAGTRVGEDGLDMARICPGRPDGSVTERAAFAVSKEIADADYLVDLHSGGLVMRMGPVVGYTLHPDTEVLEMQRRMAEAFNLPLIWGTTATLDGRTLSVARDHKVPAIYAEWLGGGGCDPEGVDAYVEGCLNVMGLLGMVERTVPVSRVRKIVEDPRAGSGHVQVNYPAPFDGFFEPEIELGEEVAPGSCLGHVVDHLGDRVEPIISTQAGILICLRVFSRVIKGDSVAAVMEDPE